MENFKYEKKDESWPANFQLTENPIFTFGWDGEEGIYFDEVEFIPYLEEAYKKYMAKKTNE